MRVEALNEVLAVNEVMSLEHTVRSGCSNTAPTMPSSLKPYTSAMLSGWKQCVKWDGAEMFANPTRFNRMNHSHNKLQVYVHPAEFFGYTLLSLGRLYYSKSINYNVTVLFVFTVTF